MPSWQQHEGQDSNRNTHLRSDDKPILRPWREVLTSHSTSTTLQSTRIRPVFMTGALVSMAVA